MTHLKSPWISVLLAFILPLLVYARALHFGFVAVTDDEYNIFRHHHDLARIWTESYMGFFIPLPYTLWTLLWKAGVGPAWYHALNIGLHALATVAVLLILRAFRPQLALFGALLFAVFTFQVEAVTWVTGLRDVLAGALALWALAAYLHERSGVAGLLAVLACLAKPSAVVLLPMALALRPSREALWFLPSLAVGLFAVSMQTELAPPDFAWPHRIRLALQALGYYLTQQPSADHWARGVSGEAGPLVFGVLTLALCWKCRGARLYALALLPTLGLVAYGGQHHSTVADRYVYLAVLGIAFLATGGVERLMREQMSMAVLVALTIVPLTWSTLKRIELWRDAETLYHSEIYRCSPKGDCEYWVKPNSAMVLSILADRRGDPVLAETYALEAKDANDWKEAQLVQMRAYREP